MITRDAAKHMLAPTNHCVCYVRHSAMANQSLHNSICSHWQLVCAKIEFRVGPSAEERSRVVQACVQLQCGQESEGSVRTSKLNAQRHATCCGSSRGQRICFGWISTAFSLFSKCAKAAILFLLLPFFAAAIFLAGMRGRLLGHDRSVAHLRSLVLRLSFFESGLSVWFCCPSFLRLCSCIFFQILDALRGFFNSR